MARVSKRGGLPDAVIDNTLLTRLVRLGIADFLPLLFKRILIPPEVRREAYRAPGKGKRRLRRVINEMAGFLVDCREADELTLEYLKADLDEGEAAAIAQADFTQSVLLLDENRGYKRAGLMQVTTIRTANLIVKLKEAGAISEVAPYFDRLEKTGFYLSVEVRQRLLEEAGESQP